MKHGARGCGNAEEGRQEHGRVEKETKGGSGRPRLKEQRTKTSSGGTTHYDETIGIAPES